MTKVEHRILVNVPVSVAYNQWTQFEDFPHFMNGIKQVTQLSDDRLEWVAEIAGVRRTWEAKILEQVPDKKVSWAATEGATNAGEVVFEDLGSQTSVQLTLEYEPEGLVEKVGDKLNVVENQTENDLKRFKALVEDEGYASGGWRGTVQDVPGTPGIEDASASRGDSGKAGVSGKVVAAGLGAAAAAAVGVAAATSKGSSDTEGTDTEAADTEVQATGAHVEPIEVADTITVIREPGTSEATVTTDTRSGQVTTDAPHGDDDPTLRGERTDRP